MKPAHIGALAGVAALAAVGIAVVGGKDTPQPPTQQSAKPVQAGVEKKRPRPIRWFVRADSNRDGKLARAEFLAFHERYYNEMDIRKSGAVTQEDIRTLNTKKATERAKRAGKPAPVIDPKAKPRPIRWFVRADNNRDGKLTKAEFFAHHEKFLDAVDQRKADMITQDDIRAHDAKKRAERGAARQAREANKPKN
ncbi:MAG: hypothetical protein LW823_09955 [Rickettsiales bacterium]|jgi:hypothetical protein|nr:hypothetical protein [Rickettsiales bacterium]